MVYLDSGILISIKKKCVIKLWKDMEEIKFILLIEEVNLKRLYII